MFAIFLAIFFLDSSKGYCTEYRYPFNDHIKIVQMARYIARRSDYASIATVSTLPFITGLPFTNVKSVVDGSVAKSTGIPYFYLSPFDITSRDLKKNSSCTIMLFLEDAGFCENKRVDDIDDPRCSRVILSGKMRRVKEGTMEFKFAKTALLERHPAMATYPKAHRWFIAKLILIHIALVDWAGRAKFIRVRDYLTYRYPGNAVIEKHFMPNRQQALASVIKAKINNNANHRVLKPHNYRVQTIKPQIGPPYTLPPKFVQNKLNQDRFYKNKYNQGNKFNDHMFSPTKINQAKVNQRKAIQAKNNQANTNQPRPNLENSNQINSYNQVKVNQIMINPNKSNQERFKLDKMQVKKQDKTISNQAKIEFNKNKLKSRKLNQDKVNQINVNQTNRNQEESYQVQLNQSELKSNSIKIQEKVNQDKVNQTNVSQTNLNQEEFLHHVELNQIEFKSNSIKSQEKVNQDKVNQTNVNRTNHNQEESHQVELNQSEFKSNSVKNQEKVNQDKVNQTNLNQEEFHHVELNQNEFKSNSIKIQEKVNQDKVNQTNVNQTNRNQEESHQVELNQIESNQVTVAANHTNLTESDKNANKTNVDKVDQVSKQNKNESHQCPFKCHSKNLSNNDTQVNPSIEGCQERQLVDAGQGEGSHKDPHLPFIFYYVPSTIEPKFPYNIDEQEYNKTTITDIYDNSEDEEEI